MWHQQQQQHGGGGRGQPAFTHPSQPQPARSVPPYDRHPCIQCTKRTGENNACNACIMHAFFLIDALTPKSKRDSGNSGRVRQDSRLQSQDRTSSPLGCHGPKPHAVALLAEPGTGVWTSWYILCMDCDIEADLHKLLSKLGKSISSLLGQHQLPAVQLKTNTYLHTTIGQSFHCTRV